MFLKPRLLLTVWCLVNNNPYITGPSVQQWTLLQEASVDLTIVDADNDTVLMFPLNSSPPNSSLVRIGDSNVWRFSWTPQNMNNIELMYDSHILSVKVHMKKNVDMC